MRQARHWQMKVAPDILIIPSKMTPLVKEIFGKKNGSKMNRNQNGNYDEKIYLWDDFLSITL